MPSQTEKSDQFSTLPPEDLNPLVNPLLSQNMGRWAEVYFNNLPANRDQAVIELLHELRAKGSTPIENSLVVEPQTSTANRLIPPPETDFSTSVILCPLCGHENRADHNFCGACRAHLTGEIGPETNFSAQAAAFLLAAEGMQNVSPPSPHFPGEGIEPQGVEAHETSEPQPFEHRKWKLSGPPTSPASIPYDTGELPGSAGRNDDDYELFSYGSGAETSRSYRIYAGLVLALLIGFLAYRAWWGGQGTLGTSGVSHSAPQLPPSPAAEAAGSPTAAVTTNTGAPTGDSSRAAAPPSPKSAPISEPTSSQTGTTSETVAQPAPVPSRSAAPNSAAPLHEAEAFSSAGTGAAELSLAKTYLSGADGKQRNTAEAAALLWKAVSKQNAEATDLLSDLYLRGDGVPKNCDQARILLDAAARKGRKNAAERLGHLEAFGCQ